MRILTITNLYPNRFQPHRAAFNYQQLRALASEHEVRVIAPIAWTSECAARSRVVGRRPDPRLPETNGTIVEHPRYFFTPRVLRGCYGGFFLRSVRRCFLRAVRDFRPDVVLGSWAYPDGWAAVRLARDAGLPVAVKVHGSDLLTAAEAPGRWRGTAEALASADAVIAVSRHLADRAIALGATRSRVHVVRNGVDTGLFRPAPRTEARRRLGLSSPDPLVLFVGNLVPVKGLDVLIRALGSLASAGRAFQFAIVGDGPLSGTLRSAAQEAGISARGRFTGALPLREMPDWYNAADVLVLPSRSEGLPNVLLEAGACGTRCIASDVGGIPEIVPRRWLVAPDDAAALSARIGEVLGGAADDGEGRPSLAGGWDVAAGRLAAILGEICRPVMNLGSRAA